MFDEWYTRFYKGFIGSCLLCTTTTKKCTYECLRSLRHRVHRASTSTSWRMDRHRIDIKFVGTMSSIRTTRHTLVVRWMRWQLWRRATVCSTICFVYVRWTLNVFRLHKWWCIFWLWYHITITVATVAIAAATASTSYDDVMCSRFRYYRELCVFRDEIERVWQRRPRAYRFNTHYVESSMPANRLE